MIFKTTQDVSNIYSDEDKKTMQELTNDVSKDRLLKIIYGLSDLENELKWSTQKNIIFQVGIMRLCSKENLTLEERVSELEKKIVSGNIKVSTENNRNSNNENYAAKAPSSKSLSTSNVQSVDKKEEKSKENVSNSASGLNADFWQNVINKLKEERKAMLFANLNNTKAIVLDDMTVGIQFLDGLNSFRKAVIERPENMNELKRLISIECGKDMRIKIIDSKNDEKKEKTDNKLDLGININYID